eukprot:14803836-Alexandrium_andersonii.AAC.1
MSASLVGSEMCIRDSNACPSARPSSTPGGSVASTAAMAAGRTAAASWACLLYTSDAADDM